MKKFVSILFFAVFSAVCFAQNYTWDFSKSAAKTELKNKEEELIINADRLNSIQINYDYNDKDTCIEIPIDDTIVKVRFNKE